MKRPDACIGPGFDIDHQAAHFSQKLATHESEVVIPLLEIGIEHHHLGEAQRQKVHGVKAGEMVEHAMAEAGLADERSVFRTIAHVEASEKILIFDG